MNNFDSCVVYIIPKERQFQVGGSYFSVVQGFDNYIQFRNANLTKTIDRRIRYLNGVTNIGDDWISGTSSAPNQYSAEISKSILDEFKNKFLDQYLKNDYRFGLVMPQIILSPIPKGGIYIEFKINEDNNFSIYVLNDKVINYEVQEMGLYNEYSIDTIESLWVKINSFFKNYANYSNTGRRNII